MEILVFDDINESHAATGYHGRTDLSTFHVFTVEDTYPSTRRMMPPYTLRFYQIVMLENSYDARLDMNTAAVNDLDHVVTFASPLHVLSWVRGEAQRGFILYFKEEFLRQQPISVVDEFPFFQLMELNWVRSPHDARNGLRDHFVRILDVFQGRHPYRVQMLQALLLALLYDCKGICDAQQRQMVERSPRQLLAFRFQQALDQHFRTHKTVQSYADLLGVSADYLSESVKQTIGKLPHRLIVGRILLEAKTLLAYSELNIAEIADYLGYPEPTHFSRLFRQQAGMTPSAWRQHRQPGN